jgi:hypothetical protein
MDFDQSNTHVTHLYTIQIASVKDHIRIVIFYNKTSSSERFDQLELITPRIRFFLDLLFFARQLWAIFATRDRLLSNKIPFTASSSLTSHRPPGQFCHWIQSASDLENQN